MFKLDVEKAEEPEIKLPTSVESWKKEESSRKKPTSAFLTMQKPLTVWITTNLKILKEMGIPQQTALPSSWEICVHDKKLQLEPDMEQQAGSKLGKEYIKAVYHHPSYLTEYIMWNARLDEAQVRIKIAGRNINNLSYADDITLMAESKEPLDEGERTQWKSWLKTQY